MLESNLLTIFGLRLNFSNTLGYSNTTLLLNSTFLPIRKTRFVEIIDSFHKGKRTFDVTRTKQ